MSYLRIEKKEPNGEWERLPAIDAADDLAASIINLTPDGGQEMIIFSCEGDHSTVSRLKSGIIVARGKVQVVASAQIPEAVATLKDGESCEMFIRQPGSLKSFTARWTHHT